MKKVFNAIIILFVFMLFPSLVLAENVQVKGINLVEKSENAEIISEPKANNTTISFNIKLNSVGDYVKYKLVIDNKDDIEYEIDKKSFDSNEYISYEVEADNLEKLEANKEKEIYLTIKYNKEVPESVFKDNAYVLNNNFSLAIGNKDEEIKNPKTGIEDYSLVILTILVLAIVIYGLSKNKKQFKPLMLIIGLSTILIPLTCIAANILKLNIETNVTIIGVDKCLENKFATDDWTTIATNVKSGNMCGYHVGDEKQVELNGFGTHIVRISNMSACTNGETSETACGFVVEFADIITDLSFNTTAIWNVGGWRDSKIRDYINDKIFKSFESDLQNIIVTTKVISSHGEEVGATNFETQDKLYLLSGEEIYGDFAGSAYVGEYDSSVGTSRRLDYYKNQGVTMNNYNEAIKYYVGNDEYNGTKAWWWLRSVVSRNRYVFYVYANGSCHSGEPYGDIGISPAFRIA